MKKGTGKKSGKRRALAGNGESEAQSAQEPIGEVVSSLAEECDWTDAEVAVFRMRADGKSVKEIASLRGRKADTVWKQILSLRRKVGRGERLQDLVERMLREAAKREPRGTT